MQDYPAASRPTPLLPDFKLWALTLFVFFSLCFRLGAMPLQSPDEGRYSEAAREILESGDWLVPHFGYVERVNKPPLFYWAAAVSMRVFGVNEIGARLPSLLAALGIALILYFLARKAWGEDAASASALVLLTSLLFAALARTAITDMLLCLCLTAAAAALWWAVQTRGGPATLLFFAAAAAGTLVKGPIALALPALIGLLFVTLSGRWRQVHWGAVAAGSLLYAALAAPWFAAVQSRYPGFLRYFFVGENLQRFAGNEHPEPLWFYAPILVAGFGVWIPSLLSGLVSAARQARRGRESDSLTLLALLWAGVIFTFFSLSKGKLPTYILPCFPPLALLIGRQWALASQPDAKPARWTRVNAVLVSAGLAAAAIGAHLLIPRLAEFSTSRQPALIATLMLAAAAIGVGCAAARGAVCARFGAVAAAGALLTLGASDAAANLLAGNGLAARTLAQVMSHSPSDTRLYTYQEDGLTALRFYLGQSLGSSKKLQDIPPLARPPIDGEVRVPRGSRSRNVKRGGHTAALAEALRQRGPFLVLLRKRDFQRVEPLLIHTGAGEFRREAGNYVVAGRLTSGPPSGKSPGREPATMPGGLSRK